jgi:hypothetical protein
MCSVMRFMQNTLEKTDGTYANVLDHIHVAVPNMALIKKKTFK